MARILLAEDDCALSEMVARTLRQQQHVVEIASDGLSAIAFIEQYLFDLLILDWNLPGKSGVEICSHYRNQGRREPILFLTAKSDIADKEQGLHAGADDYLTKPFELRELTARVGALLRRPPTYVSNYVVLANLQLDTASKTLSNGEKQIKLPPREAALLEFFARRSRQVISSEALLTSVWGSQFEGTELALRSCLTKLRKALAALGHPNAIETIHGFGYRLNL